MIAARLLGPRDYGAFAAMMGLLPRRHGGLARPPGDGRPTDRLHARTTCSRSSSVILRVGLQARVGVGVLCLALAPVINQVRAPRQPGHGRAHRPSRWPADHDGRAGRDPPGRASVVPARDDLPRRGRRPAAHRHRDDRSGRPTEFAAAARRGHRRLRPGRGRLARPAALARPQREDSGEHSDRRPLARGRCTTPTPCSRSSRSPTSTSWCPQRARRAPGRPVRRRADPGQGRAVPAAVRGRARVPLDVRRGRRAGRP